MLKKVIASHLSGEYSVFLFGSQAGKQELIRADIDLGIDAGKALDIKTYGKIYNEINELRMLYKVDLVDFCQVENSFKMAALRNIEKL